MFVLFFSVRNKSGNFYLQRHGRTQQGARGTWYFQKPFNDAASCQPPSRGGLSLSFLFPAGSEPIWGHSTAFCHAHRYTHVYTHSHKPTSCRASNRRRQNACHCVTGFVSIPPPNHGQDQLLPGLKPAWRTWGSCQANSP